MTIPPFKPLDDFTDLDWMGSRYPRPDKASYLKGLSQEIDDMRTSFGTAKGDRNMGKFDGDVLPGDTTLKVILQAIENRLAVVYTTAPVVASEDEAIAGADNAKVMTPLRVAQKIADFIAANITPDLEALNPDIPYLDTAYQGALSYLSKNASVRSTTLLAGVGHMAFARGSVSGSGEYAAAIASAYVGVNDMDNAGTWLEYGTAVQTPGRTSPLHLYEGDIAHLGGTVVLTPQGINTPGLSNGLRLMSGGELAHPPYNYVCGAASAAIVIGSNDPTYRATWNKGIVFHDGFCATPIAMGLNDRIQWFSNGTAQSALTGAVFGRYVTSDSDCYVDSFTRLTAAGQAVASGGHLGRQDYYDHGGGSTNNANVSVKAVSLGTPAAGYVVTAKNTDNQYAGYSLHANGMNTFSPTVDNALSIGSASFRWSQLFAGTSLISTSDARLKKDLGSLNEALLAAFTELWGSITYGQFLDAIAAKGEENARYHIWIIAQTIVTVFQNHGLDAFAYGVVGKDPWMVASEETYDVQVQKTETVSVTFEDIQIIDGKATIVESTKDEVQPVTELQLIWNADGTPAMETVEVKSLTSGENPTTVTRQRARIVPVMVTETRTRTVQTQKIDTDGSPMEILSVRNDEIMYGILAAMFAAKATT